MPDKIVSLSRFRAEVSRALARRGAALLASKQLDAEVAQLQPLEAYYIVKEMGVGEAVPILLAARPEQLRAFIDLDCWEGDRLAIADVDAWLSPFAAVGAEALGQAFLQLDDEVQVLFLASSLRVYDVRSEEAPAASDDTPRTTTVDGFFVIEVIAPQDTDEEREVDPLFLIDSLYKTSLDNAVRLLLAAKWESGAILEEQAYQFRSGRLQDLGFAEPSEAVRIFAPPPSRPNARQLEIRGGEPQHLPAIYAAPLAEEGLLTRALAQVSDAHLVERLERDLIYLINAAVVAYGQSPRNVQYAGEIAGRVRDTLSLGLEVLLQRAEPLPHPVDAATVAEAQGLLAAWPLSDVFRYGHQAARKLATQAQKLTADPVFAAWLARSENEQDDYSEARRDRAFVHALLGRPPLLGGFDPLHPERLRAFTRRAELEEATARLTRIAEQVG